jgi:hypothetical protein
MEQDLSLVFAGTLTLNVDDCGGLVAGSGGVVGEFLRFWNDAYFLPREVAVSVVDGGGGGAGLGNRALCLSYAPLEDAGSDEGLIIAGL